MKRKYVIISICIALLVVLARPIYGVLVIAAILGEAVLYNSDFLYPDYVHRYRLTVNVEVDGQERSGSGVFEVHTRPGPALLANLGNGAASPQAFGEAIPVDIGSRGVLVMLLRGRGIYGPRSMAFETFANYPQPDQDQIPLLKKMSDLRAAREIPPTELWEMVVLDNPADPKTMRAVDVSHPEKALGDGVRFLPAHIEMTKDPVTIGIEKIFPWVAEAPSGFIVRPIKSNAPFFYERSDFELGAQ